LNAIQFILASTCVCCCAASVEGQVVNGDFENGLLGWQFNLASSRIGFIRPMPDPEPGLPYAYPFPSSTTPLANHARVGGGFGNDGSSGLQLFSPQTVVRLDFTGPDSNSYSLTPSSYTMSLSQDLQLSAGSAITGWARFSSEDNPGFKDFASITINGGSVWRCDLNALQNRWPAWTDGPWQQWEFVVPADGTYHLSLNIFGDDDRSSAAYFDNIRVVPEPTALALMVLGLALFTAARKGSSCS
jgi:hypothetical protein